MVKLIQGSGTEASDDERNSEGSSKRQEILTQLTETVYDTLGKAWPSNHLTQGKPAIRYRSHLAAVLLLCVPQSSDYGKGA